MSFCGIFCCQKDDRFDAPLENITGKPARDEAHVSAPLVVQQQRFEDTLEKLERESTLIDAAFEFDQSEYDDDESEGVGKVEDAKDDVYRVSISTGSTGSGKSDLGIDVDSTDGVTLLILKVRDGPLQRWNETAAPEVAVRHLDRIQGVNGVSGDAAELLYLIRDNFPDKEPTKFELTIKHPKEIITNFDKGADGLAGKLGLDIAHSCLESLCVKRVKAGMVQDWNKKHPKRAVGPGDRIVEINGQRGAASSLLDLLSTQTKLKIIFSRTKLEGATSG